MAEAGQPIGFHYEEATAANVRDAPQVARLTDALSAINATPGGPKVFFVFSPNEAFEVDAPNHVVRLHEVQCGKWNGNRGSPPVFVDTRFRGPYAVPTGIAVARARISALLFCDQRVPLRAQRIDLKHVGIAPIMGGVNDDLEIVVQLLAHVAPQFGCNDALRIGVGTRYAEVDFVLAIKNADFGMF